MTRISSLGRPRSDGARTNVEASEIVFWPTKKEGTIFLIESMMFAAGWVASSVALMTSTGEAELVSVRSVRRVPRTMISLPVSAGATVVIGALTF